MNLAASFRANYGVLPQCCSSRCCSLQFQPLVATSSLGFGQRDSYRRKKELKLFPVQRKRETFCRVTDAQTEPDGNNDEESGGEDKEALADEPPSQAPPTELVPEATVVDEAVGSNEENKVQFSSQDGDKLEFSTGSPLPGVNPLQLDDSMRLPKETIDILKDQVFGFDTFFVTSQEPYEGGVLFKGNLRGQPAKSYEKIKTRLEVATLLL